LNVRTRTEEEIAQIYCRQIDTVYRVCFLFLKRRADAEDAAQATFLKLISRAPALQNERHEKAWLIVTAANVCKNVLASAWRKRVVLTEEAAFPPAPERAGGLLASVLALPDRYKTAIYMHYYEGYSAAEIARAMGKSENSVYGYLHKGRKLLKAELLEEERG